MGGTLVWDKGRQVEKELDDLLRCEEIFWRQSFRVNWMRDGGRNTKVFHAKASSRRTCNKIHGLFDVSGNWKEDNEDIADIIDNYFYNIFSCSCLSPAQLNAILDTVSMRLQSTSRDFSDAKFSTHVVKVALFQMSLSKAPGKDGFPTDFYQNSRGCRSGPKITHLFCDDDSLSFTRTNSEECLNIRRLLEVYSPESGQLINFNKSAVCFSSQISSKVKNGFTDVLGMKVVESHEMYLGLPFQRSRSERLCKAKSMGGLGFRDIGAFNKAMLAKQCWRLHNNPCSLVAKRRNKAFHGQTLILDIDIWEWAISFVYDFCECNKVDNKVGQQGHSTFRLMPRWQAPRVGVFKINTDVATRVRDMASKPLAILKGIGLAYEYGFLPAVLESDALRMVNAISLKEVPHSEVEVIIQDILSLLMSVSVSSVNINIE
ncbi:hypothetical protein Ddye_001853 [Dipteronia dyeriana]|uniref:Reverse transcriptase domain-containing protein n=1 Tax=Dipteronia dyeriana TaxID=168575 RepID=A0AAE0CTX8_9ROSI|nr:hypothetical protein Ddye_001853 [Dipteronia dyeriana]